MQIRITNDVNPAFCLATKSRLSGHTSLQNQFEGKNKNFKVLKRLALNPKCRSRSGGYDICLSTCSQLHFSGNQRVFI